MSEPYVSRWPGSDSYSLAGLPNINRPFEPARITGTTITPAHLAAAAFEPSASSTSSFQMHTSTLETSPPASAVPVSAVPAAAAPASVIPAAVAATLPPAKVSTSAVLPPPADEDEDITDPWSGSSGTVNIAWLYGCLPVYVDSRFAQLLVEIRNLAEVAAICAQPKPIDMTGRRKNAIFNAPLYCPTTCELVPMYTSPLVKNSNADTMNLYAASKGGAVVEFKDNIGICTIQCAKGHRWTGATTSALAGWCAICEYTELFGRNPHAGSPLCTVTKYIGNGYKTPILPFVCPEGHKFGASLHEATIGVCTVCAVINRYRAAGIHISIVSGEYAHYNSLLRAQCHDCFREFLLDPHETPTICTKKHALSSQRGLYVAMVRRCLETIFGDKFDEHPPIDEYNIYLDAYSSKYGFGIVVRSPMTAKLNSNPQSFTRWQHATGQHVFTLEGASTRFRDIIMELYDILSAGSNKVIKKYPGDVKLTFIKDLIELMNDFSKAGYEYPTREHPLSIARRLCAAHH